jgi:long-chain acyl-CoA synthetase
MTDAKIADDPYAARPWLASYPPHAPADIDEASYSTINAMFMETVAEYGGRPAVESFGATVSYAQLAVAAKAVASWLQARGLEKGQRVAIMSPNVATYPALVFGILLAGGVVVNVNPLYVPHELEHQLNDAGARFIFVLENFAHTVAAAWPNMRVEQAIVTAPGDLLGLKGLIVNAVSRWVKRAVRPYDIPGSVRFADVMREGRARPPQPVDVSRDDIAFLQYTGGTTGVAKGAVLLHRNVAANVAQAIAWVKPLVAGRHIMVTALPLYHIFGLTACCLLVTRIGGCCLMIANPRDIPGFVKTLRKSPFTMFSGVNTLYAALADNKDFASVDFSRLIFCISGGMATQSAVARRWKGVTGKAIVEGYGLSETSPIVTSNLVDLHEFSGSIGYPYPSTHISIRLADGSPAPFGERGELCVKGPQVMSGYWMQPEETADVMTEDGFFRTGDVAVMLPGGQIKIVDRIKDVIIVSGFNVYPNEVEDVLAHHPKVKEVGVFGAPDEHSGEAVIACIVKRDESLAIGELRAFVHENLTGYKRPRHYEFRESLPKTAVGKNLRRKLRDEYVARRVSEPDAG